MLDNFNFLAASSIIKAKAKSMVSMPSLWGPLDLPASTLTWGQGCPLLHTQLGCYHGDPRCGPSLTA